MNGILFLPLIQLINENLWTVGLCSEGNNRFLFQLSCHTQRKIYIRVEVANQRLILYRCISLSHLLYLVFSSYNHIHTHFPTHVSRTDRADREREEEKGKALCNKVFTVGGKMSKIEQTRAPIYYVQIILYLVWQWPIVESRTSHPVCSLLLLLSRFSRIWLCVTP